MRPPLVSQGLRQDLTLRVNRFTIVGCDEQKSRLNARCVDL
jgi:hypothetical protein